METIKNYLETMFANLPNTAPVLKAKAELLQMMEDKYTELIERGETTNSAVGTVISEFGNLDELADELGIYAEVHNDYVEEEKPEQYITMDEAKNYLKATHKAGLMVGLGVMLCIMSVIGPILMSALMRDFGIGTLLMFLMIGGGVVLIVFGGVNLKPYRYIFKQRCQIDMQTANMLCDEKRRYESSHALRLTLGIILCALCWLPEALVSQFAPLARFGGIYLFIMVGVGVFLIIYTDSIKKGYKHLLGVNDISRVNGNYNAEQKPEYRNEGAAFVMSIFWPIVSCGYICASFITFNWRITWIVWPIAVAIFVILKLALRNKE